jgi:acetyl esterase/lipase
MLTAQLLLALSLGVDPLGGLDHIRLWEGKAPASVGNEDKNVPTLTPFVPKEPNGAAVVVCPGGGYGMLAVGHEGRDIGEWLNKHGVTAFVLKYRIVQYDRPGPLQPAPMLDVQRAIRWVRANAKKYNIDPQKVGVWGFSAGGHLASTAATHFDSGKNDGDEIDKQSCRPDFAILAYPVITMVGKPSHGGSKRNLLGDKPDEKLVEFYSNDKQVTSNTPPTFLFHTEEDTGVPAENSRMFYEACKAHGVPVELAIYEKGKHGVGLAQNDPVLSKWPDKLAEWMKGRGLLEPKR